MFIVFHVNFYIFYVVLAKCETIFCIANECIHFAISVASYIYMLVTVNFYLFKH